MPKARSFDAHDTFLLGHPDYQVNLPDDECVLRHHFILEACPPQACVRDLGSRNGTYVNGRKVGGPKEVRRRKSADRQRPGSETKNPSISAWWEMLS
uniref:FHA domain-containing protein n=1 Tax=Prosthecobacter sp. TaxID=1965333 RepID=UPI003783CE35